DFLGKIIVSPILSKCHPPNYIYDICVGIVTIVLITFIVRRLWEKALLPLKWIIILVASLLIYMLYRVQEFPFQFTSLELFKKVKLFDILAIIPSVALLINLINSIKYKSQEKNTCLKQNDTTGFVADEPTAINENNDFGFRDKFIKEVVAK